MFLIPPSVAHSPSQTAPVHTRRKTKAANNNETQIKLKTKY